MSKVKTIQGVSNVKDLAELARYIDIVVTDILAQLNGRVSFTDNCLTCLTSVVFAGASTTIAVPHTLGIVPTGYVVVGKSAAIHVYDGSGQNDKSTLYVQASAAGTARLLIF